MDVPDPYHLLTGIGNAPSITKIKGNDHWRSEVDRQLIIALCHVQHDLSTGYPFRFDVLLIEGAMNQNVAILGGIRGSLDFPGEPVSAHLAVGNLHLVNRGKLSYTTVHALFKPL